jgi:hypothetical protein
VPTITPNDPGDTEAQRILWAARSKVALRDRNAERVLFDAIVYLSGRSRYARFVRNRNESNRKER